MNLPERLVRGSTAEQQEELEDLAHATLRAPQECCRHLAIQATEELAPELASRLYRLCGTAIDAMVDLAWAVDPTRFMPSRSGREGLMMKELTAAAALREQGMCLLAEAGEMAGETPLLLLIDTLRQWRQLADRCARIWPPADDA